MQKEKEKKDLSDTTKPKLQYTPPRMITYSEDELLEEIGPIQACTGFGSAVVC